MDAVASGAFHWPVRVYYSDTDAGGVVYHANYLNFFEHARTEMLRSLGFEQDRLMAENLVFAVRQMTIDFVRPARFNQQLEVVTSLVKLGGVSLVFEQQLMDEAGEVYCQAQVKIGSLSADSFTPTKIPQSIKQELARAG
ncbi:tol-pal system-associated acyl-CoA thioesterase [Ferrimonas balearica]|uniref:tol-pal system-associated acyl-CoA thioesterase n=1 Tax=Ferrimonas balearica TaxID=44012 RepID=UPI001C99D4BA|nr:tol-pal system-associated acyl-CoA thioesterase [Ferrimonas balearica]MBY5920041.1 tol-pal system-associated acyl-CoA thioesterase [Ferrimonas balearica]MBY5997274.1 tol-pal system-associated acyl-CoA thioesterase [Ferrimonas balearica]